MQSSLFFLPLTFDEDHDLSITQHSGEIYLVLEHAHHGHGHEHHHHDDVSSGDHDHQDHLIKLPKVQEKVLKSIQVIKFQKQIATYDNDLKSLFSWEESLVLEAVPKRCRGPNEDFKELKNSIQILV